MKETKNINLAGCALVIDDDAAQKLSQYLSEIESHLQASDSKDEIMRDIEARIVELLRQHLNYSHAEVVNISMVEDVMNQLGTPEVITECEEAAAKGNEPEDATIIEESTTEAKDETEDATTEASNAGARPHVRGVKNKRLYRSADDQKIAGVCAGIATYLGIDAIWLRLLLLISVLFYGTGIMLYLFLWLVMPLANTTSRKLEQQGVEPSAENIRQEVERQKEYQIQHPNERQKSTGSGVAGGCLIALGLIVGLPLIIALFAVLMATFGLSLAAVPLASFVGLSASSIFGVIGIIICGLMIFIIPIVVLIVWNRHRNNSDKPLSKWFWIIALLLWIASFVGANYGGVHVARQVDNWDTNTFEQRIDSLATQWGISAEHLGENAEMWEQILDSIGNALEAEIESKALAQ